MYEIILLSLGVTLFGLAVMAYGLWQRRVTTARRREVLSPFAKIGVPEDDPLLRAMRSIVARHLTVLATERRRKLVPDKYGLVDRSRWDAEVNDFIDRVASPYLLATVPGKAHRSSLRRMTKLVRRAMPSISDADAPRLILRMIIEDGAETHQRIVGTADEQVPSSPAEFEHWCAAQLRKAGWQTTLTGQSGDQGVDIQAMRDGVVLVVQCKLYQQPVGNSAVQQVFAGKAFYRAHAAAVVATCGYTTAARTLAQQCGVELLTPQQLCSYRTAHCH